MEVLLFDPPVCVVFLLVVPLLLLHADGGEELSLLLVQADGWCRTVARRSLTRKA